MSHGFTVEELVTSCQELWLSSVAVWWPMIPMSHGFTVEEFMTRFQDFKCGCLVACHPYLAWFYSRGIHDRLSRVQVRLFGGLSSLCRMVLQLRNS